MVAEASWASGWQAAMTPTEEPVHPWQTATRQALREPRRSEESPQRQVEIASARRDAEALGNLAGNIHAETTQRLYAQS